MTVSETTPAAATTTQLREELLLRRLAGDAAAHHPQITPVDRSSPLPLSFGQQQLWFLSRLAPDSPEYLVPLTLRLRGPLDVAALRRSWEHVVTRHEILRTRYVLRGNEPAQVVDPPGPADFPVVDVSGVPEAEREARAVEIAELASLTPMDLAGQWPVRVLLVRLAADDHVLSVVLHHIACDAWSLEVLGEELSALYRAFAAGQPASLPPLPVQYGDFAVWQRAHVSGEVLERHLAYWRTRLAGMEPTELPTDRPRPSVRSWQGAAVPFDIPDDVAEGVRELGRRHGATPFMVLLAALQTLLARYTGKSDIAVGTVVSERSAPELQKLIGYGINSLVMRSEVTGDMSFAELLAGVRTTVLDAFDHADVPFARLVDELQPERDTSRTPLFQVAFTMHEPNTALFDLAGVLVERMETPWRVAKFDLALQVEEGPDGHLRGQFEYAVGLFGGWVVRGLAEHFVRLVRGVVADAGVRVSVVGLLSAQEWGVVAAPAVGGVLVDGVSVGEVFARRVAVSPGAVAVVCGGVELTYGEVDERANRLAHCLRGLGVGPGSLVGVCVERGVDLVPALVGVVKSGGGYVPLDPAYPVDRLGFMLADTAASVVVTSAGLAARVAGVFSGSVVVLGSELVAGQSVAEPVPLAGGDDVLYVIYTSGSTGQPKGVQVTQANVLRLLACGRRLYGFDEADVWPLFHSYAFDVSVWELWGALLYGGRLVVVPFAVARAPEEFLDLLVQHRVTVLNQTPSAFGALVAAAAAGDPRVDELVLRLVVFAGEKLEIARLAPWVARRGLDAPVLANMYGITETTVHSTFHRITAADLDPAAGNPVGVPLADLGIYLLDPHGNPVPVGVPGEIYVGGPGVARGYLNRAELTAARFVPDPFGTPGTRLYRSGDLARRAADGSLQFLGRLDDQVKIRGYRIELGEIQAALRGHPQVTDAVVIAVEDTPGEHRLLAYLVPTAGAVLDPRSLRAHLAAVLPDYMLPARYLPVEHIPLTTNGKLDRKALPTADHQPLHPATSTPPRTPLEHRIATAWADILTLDHIGIHDNFFDAGGDSIRAVALVGALRDAGLDVAVRDIFEFRTVAGLTEMLAGRPALAEGTELVAPYALVSAEDRARLPGDVVDAYPLSQVQSGMVVEMLASRETNTYHNITTFRIRDDRPFSAPALHDAVRAAVRRHEVLRTSIRLTEYAVPMQLVHRTAELPVQVHDLRGLSPAEQDRALREFTARERATLFDLVTPPLLRVAAHVTDEHSWWISMTECHAILEGWSYHSLLMELLDHYRDVVDGAVPAPAAPPALRYADFIAAELRSLESAEDRAYWRAAVTGRDAVALPPGWGGDDAGGSYRTWVPFDDLEEALRTVATKTRVSLKSVVFAAHLKVMSMLTDASTFYTGLVCNARPEVLGADRVHGLYLNTLPFRHDRSARTWRELVRQTFAQEVELWPHRRFPMPVIQREMAGGQRLVDVRFSFLNFRQIDTDRVDLAASIDDSPTEFGLAVHGVPGSVVLTGDTRLVSRANVDRLGRMHRAVLEAMVADIDGDASVTLLPDEERLQLLVEWNDTSTAAGSGGCLPELFEAQVRRVPEAAAAFAGAAVSYAELDALANRFAHRLRASGVGPESVVGVLLDRGPDLLACLLGVWKAGGAYLPLDPSYPADRLDYMLADAGARVVVTQSGHADRFAADRVDERILVDRDRASIEAQPATAPARVDDPDRTAYVIYTSGSTGRPKGVQVTHRGLGNHVSWAAEVLASRGSTGAPLFSSVAFDLVVPNLWAPLVTGQPVHLLPADLDLADLGQSLVDSGPFSFIKLTPGHLDLLSRQLDDEQAAALAAVIVVAGEALPGKAADRWLRLLGPGRLINEYGPTEASVGTSIFPIVEPARTEIVPIGRPLPNMTMYVLDAQMQPVPIGVLGELYVGGTGVARGYTGKPVLTAERFLPDPFGPPGARLYRTGDAVRMGPDGAVAFAGRVDDQIKMRGYRIEPGEIRSVLLDHAGVRDAVVIAHDYGAEDRQLVAYCVAMADGPLSADELARHCATRLPDYMVPAVFVPLERIPLNANGKVDRAALPAPERAAAPGATTGPQTPLQEQIAQVWCSVLDRDRVGIHDNFFDLGGHSIRAVALVGALRAAGLDVSVRDVFEHRTVAALAAALATQSGPVEDTGPVAPFELISAEDRVRVPDGVLDAYPLSEVQRGMVVEMLADEALSPYHNTTSFLLRDEHPFSLPALLEATRIAVQRHEMLRTSFDLTGYSVPMQLVHATAEPAVTMVDLRGLDGGEQESALRRFIARERAATFDLHTPPLLRMTALIQSDRRWRLSFTQLHAITEGWSFHSLLMELLDRYHRIRDGLRLEVAELGPVRYADFIAAEQRSLASTEDREYWRGIVERYPTLSLPAGWRADPGLPREDFQVNVWHGDLESDLRALATRARSSLKSVLHAAHLKVMSMVTHEPVFASGLVCNARPELQGADGVYGMHLNSLPFAFERTAGTWLELVEQVFAREVELWPHRRFPMPAIQREMTAGRRLVDVLFTFQDFHQVDTDMVDTEAGAGDDSTEFALGVPCTPQFIGLRTNTHVMTRENAQRLADMYRAVLVAMAADPDGDARETVLPADERARLLALATGAGRPAAATRCLHEMFEAQVAARPDAVAVVYERARLTFAEVNAAANRLAHRLRGLGVGPESVVGVCLEPGLDLVPTLLGVLKAGGAYLPVPPAYPADRLDYMLSDTAAPVVVTRKEHAGVLTGFGGVVIILDEDTDTLAGQPSTDPHPASSPDNLAYVIYTSGSTGRPKGVGVTHGNVSRLFAATADQMLTGPDEAWALLHSYAFDASVWEIWGALLHGGRVVVVPQAVAQAPEELLTLLERQRVTVIGLSPVAFRAVVAAAGGDTARLSRLALRAITFGGDRLEAADIAEWVASQGLPRTALGQAYGPTEATVHVTYHRLGTGDLETADGIPIGRPIDDMRAYVLDTDGGLAPAGVPGELCAGGAGIARGYVGRPDLTAERFVPDPYGPPGSRYYRTGDLVRMRPDGNLDFLGRTDEQIKVRGYRIEPGEIQAVLVDHPAVREAVVTAHGAASSDRRLVAYCVPAAGGLPASAELAAYCAARLPDYMVPVAFVSMARVPLTGSGKLDQRALPVPDRSSLWASQEYVAPSTPTEQRLTDIWSRVLGVARVGVTDRFFDIGGDSVTVLRAMSAAREIGLPLSVRMLYQYGSIAEVARAIDSAMAGPGDGHVTGELPLTPIQHMVLDRAAGYPHDHRQAWLAFASGVDADALEASLAALTAHHEALRVRLVRGDSGPRWAIATAETARLLQRVDLSTLPEERRAVAAEDAVAGAYQRLDPESGPVISAVLLHAGAGEPDRLVVAAHEFVMDTASWAVLLSDLDTAYRQVAVGQEVALPPASGTLRRWAVGLADAATSGEVTEQAPYWLNRAPVPASPADRPAGMNTVASERTVESTIQAAHAYPPEVLIAALAVVLARWTGGDRVLLDVEARPERGGVDAADLTRVAGPFAHRYPLALWLPPRREPAAVLRSVGDQLRMVPAGGTGYGLLRQLPADRDVAGALAELPAAAVRFRFAAGCGPQTTFDIDKLVTVRDPLAAREHVLEVDAVREPDQLTVSWTYSAAVHDEATVRRLVEEYPVELRRLAAVMAPDAGAVRSPGVLPSPLPTMAGHHVPGVSVAVMQGGELVSRQAYGVLDAREAEPVTIDSLFRVASVSKHISALGALRLVADGWLDLDEDVNSYLVSWQVPYPDARSPVTLRELLANTAGLSREPEYEPYRHDGPVPTALDALHGRAPARTPAIVQLRPSGAFEKNRVNYLVLEQLMVDLTGVPFPELMRALVFEPLGMATSSYDPAYHRSSGRPVARGHDALGVPVPELGPAHPAAAAGGLWTTAGDLARAELEIRRAYLGQPALITQSLARQMMTPTAETLYGLSTIVDFQGTDLDFGIVGEFTGYWAAAMCRASSGDGFVLLTNGDSGREIAEFVIGATGGSTQLGRA